MRCLRLALLWPLAASPAEAQTLSGQWRGWGVQTGPGDYRSEWSANLSLDGATGHMEYPSLQCGGTLTFERREGNVHVYRERITYGRDGCLDNGLVGVEPVGASMRWQWTGSGARATALLHAPCPRQSPNAGNASGRTTVATGAD
jgi:hypothetical protein